ncbi:alpha/beta fold hydrolase [Bounagaea algeriensis]
MAPEQEVVAESTGQREQDFGLPSWFQSRAQLPAALRGVDLAGEEVEQLRSITSPVLALVSGKSTVHDPRKAVDRATRLIPDARVELWPSAGHAISAECADAVNARLLDFLDHLTDAGTP